MGNQSLRHQAQRTDTYVIEGVRVNQEIDGFDNHRLVLENMVCSAWRSRKGMSIITVNKKTYVGVTEYWRNTFPPVFRMIFPEGVAP
jgi:sRNA-binding regulator protein Hfq